MGLTWLLVGEWMLDLPTIQRQTEDAPPVMDTLLERTLIQIWIRWDAHNYLRIAEKGYAAAESVFYPLYPVLIHYSNKVLPGEAEVAGLLISSLCLSIACAFFYLIVLHYYQDETLARFSVLMWLIFPSSFFLSSVFTESLFMALATAAIWLQLNRQWVASAALGVLAVLTRSQGIVLLAPLGWIILETAWADYSTHRERIRFVLSRAFPLLLLPAAMIGFLMWREAEGFPPLDVVFREYGVHAELYNNPLIGFKVEVESLFKNPGLPYLIDFAGFLVAFFLLLVMLIVPRYRFPVLLLYGWGIFLSLGTKVNYYPDSVPTIQSGLRYVLMIFPMYLVLGDVMMRGGRVVRLGLVALLFLGLLLASGATALSIGPA